MTMRQSMSLPLAALVTFALFWSMQYLIQITADGRPEIKDPPVIVLHRALEDSDVVPPKPQPKRPDLVDAPPPPPMTIADTVPGKDGTMGQIPVVQDAVVLTGPALGPSQDRDVMPIVTVAPQYPRPAVARGIEGWVQVEFTISKYGAVVNPVVIDHDPSSIFDRAALKAVQGWKYKPQIVNGEAVERHGVQVVITFELDK